MTSFRRRLARRIHAYRQKSWRLSPEVLEPRLLLSVTLPNLPAGSQYQLAFVTSERLAATSKDIGFYNNIVARNASDNPALPSTTWKAWASTATVDARANASTYDDIPIYNLRGELIANGSEEFLYPIHRAAIAYDQFGFYAETSVATGSSFNGYSAGESALGEWLGHIGLSTASTSPRDWSTSYLGYVSWNHALYGLSGVLTVPDDALLPPEVTGLSASRSANGVLLQWLPVLRFGSAAPSHYVVRFSQDAGRTWNNYVDSHTETTVYVSGLQTDSKYLFEVAAVNRVGVGPFARSGEVVLSDAVSAPLAPTNVTVSSYSNSFVVEWEPPLADGGQPITSHTLTYSKDYGRSWTELPPTGSGASFAIHGGFEPGFEYRFKVAATNSAGLGTFSLPSVDVRATLPAPNVPKGSSYQLAFVTSEELPADSKEIGFYDSIVTRNAHANVGLAGFEWRSWASTPTVNARDHAVVSGPVYNLAGQMVSRSAGDFLFPVHEAPIQYDQFGFLQREVVATGSSYNGYSSGSASLGNWLGSVGLSYGSATPNEWVNTGSNYLDRARAFYGLSEVIVSDGGNAAPSTIRISGAELAGDPLPGTVVGRLSAEDSDEGDTHAYSLVRGPGDAQNDAFFISGSELRVRAPDLLPPNAEMLSIRVRAKDRYGFPVDSVLTIRVTGAKPSAPSEVKATAGDGKVTLTWTASSSDGGATIADYVVQYSSDGGTSWATFVDGTTPTTFATVTGLANGTSYTFRVAASNSHGTGAYSPASSPVQPRTTPSPPSGVSGLAGNRQVHLSWTAPLFSGGATITDYVIQYKAVGASSWATFNDGASISTSTKVTGLQNGTSYIFRVAAINSAGTGEYSASSSTITPVSALYEWPVSSGGNGHFYEFVLVDSTWSAARTTAESNGGYLATITSASEQAFVQSIMPSTKAFWLGGFQNRSASDYSEPSGGWRWVTGESWSFDAWGPSEPNNVRFNEDFLGLYLLEQGAPWIDAPATDSMSILIEYEVPDAPTQLVGSPANGQVSLSWTAPAFSGSAEIIDYVIQYSIDGGLSWAIFVDDASPATSATVTGLINGNSYTFRVAAVTRVGAGVYSPDTLTLMPEIAYKWSPIQLRAMPGMISGELFVSWELPAGITPSFFSDYRLQVSSDNGRAWQTVPDGVSANMSASLVGLQPTDAYAVRVAGVNADGESEWSEYSTAVMPEPFIQFVQVGDPGNAADYTGYGAVADEYRIGKFEVTIGQYAEFLNAVARTDSNFLYEGEMASRVYIAGISRSGVNGMYSYSVIEPTGLMPSGASSPANRPITFTSWWDAARFANWMANGRPMGPQATSTTENGAYDLSNSTSGAIPAINAINPNTGLTPIYRIPTENEWYKAAFYKGGGGNSGYWAYATQSDTAPGNMIGGEANQANYYAGVYSVTRSSGSSRQNHLTDVGAFTNSPSFYGTFDQSGNVAEWNDLTGAAGVSRGIRGGGWDSGGLSSVTRYVAENFSDQYVNDQYGFRLAAVSDPLSVISTLLLPSPSAVVARMMGGTATISWQQPAASSVVENVGYVVELSINDGVTWVTANDALPADATSHEVTDLVPGFRYHFRVAARTRAGVGAFSTAVSPSGFPDNVVDVSEGKSLTAASSQEGPLRMIKRGLGTLILDLANTHSGGTVVEAGEVIVRNPLALGSGSLIVQAGAKLTLDIGPRRVTLPSMTIAGTGTLDLGAGSIALAAGSYDLAALRGLVVSGRNNGAWTGTGITSRSVRGVPFREVGYRVLPDGSAIVGFSAVGDANMDGFVNVQDLIALNAAGKYGSVASNTNWWEGDFNYDGLGNINDLIALLSSGLYGRSSYLPLNSAAVGVLSTAESLTATGVSALSAVPAGVTLSNFAAPVSQPEPVLAATSSATARAPEPRRIDRFNWAAIANQGEIEKPADRKVARWRMLGR